MSRPPLYRYFRLFLFDNNRGLTFSLAGVQGACGHPLLISTLPYRAEYKFRIDYSETAARPFFGQTARCFTPAERYLVKGTTQGRRENFGGQGRPPFPGTGVRISWLNAS